jgi:glycosyl transferase, family 25
VTEHVNPADTRPLAALQERARTLSRHFRPENRARLLRLPRAELTLMREARRLTRGADERSHGTARLSSISVINLASRPDRLEKFLHDTGRLCLGNVQRIEAVADEYGAVGCALSHALCMEQMIERNWPAMMVCEDDARFRVDRAKLDALVERFLDDDAAEAACLAYFHREASPHDDLYLRTTNAQTAACYVIKQSLAPELLETARAAAAHLAAGGPLTRYSFDQAWKTLQRSHVFLIPIVRAATQRPGYSDISRGHVRYRV